MLLASVGSIFFLGLFKVFFKTQMVRMVFTNEHDCGINRNEL